MTAIGGPASLGRGLSRLASRKTSWYVLAVLGVCLLALGSVHASPASQASRIGYLDSVIKCPQCDDISLAQSNIVEAQNLKDKIAELVHHGATNAEVEAYVVGRYGTAEILDPATHGIDASLWIVPLVVVGLAVVALCFYFSRRRGQRSGREGEDEDESLVAAARRVLSDAR